MIENQNIVRGVGFEGKEEITVLFHKYYQITIMNSFINKQIIEQSGISVETERTKYKCQNKNINENL